MGTASEGTDPCVDCGSTAFPAGYHPKERNGVDVDQAFAEGAGRVLRHARQARGLTLRDVGLRSGGAFSPTAVAGYERGERGITLERFCKLADFYGVLPDRLLAEIVGDPADIIVDLASLEEPQVTPSSGS